MSSKKNSKTYSVKIMRAMITIYCVNNHNSNGELCDSCSELFNYTTRRFALCPQKRNSPCSLCDINCYSSEKRAELREVMKFSGPRMFFRHPIMTLVHAYEYLVYKLFR